MNAIQVVKKLYGHFAETYHRQIAGKVISGLIKEYPQSVPALTIAQKKELDLYWAQYHCKADYQLARFCYHLTGIQDPRYIPSPLFYDRIVASLNNLDLAGAWEDKAFYASRFPGEEFPRTIVQNIHGRFYDSEYNLIDKKKAIRLTEQEDKLVIKPTLDTGCGKNVQLISTEQIVPAIFDEYKSDYILQEAIVQHPMLSALNESSVNVFRINTLRIGSEIHIIAPCLRVGAPGSFVDNYIDEKKQAMLTIGVGKDGKLMNNAYFANGIDVDRCLNGAQFAGLKIPGYEKAVDKAMSFHAKLPHFDFVGWDVSINQDGEPTFIEFNLGSPGILYYQYAHGPLFGDDTDAILLQTLGT